MLCMTWPRSWDFTRWFDLESLPVDIKPELLCLLEHIVLHLKNEEVSAVCSMEGMWRAAGWRAVSPRGPLQRYGFVQRTFCHRVEHNLSI